MNFTQPSAARIVNRYRILNIIRREGALSRADIAQKLDLNKPSTSEIVKALISEKLLEEGKKRVTGNGRRPIPVDLSRTGRAVVAVEIKNRYYMLALSDMRGNLLRFERRPVPANPDPRELCVPLLKSLLKITHGQLARIAGCVITLPGEISSDRRTLVSHPDWGWEQLPLADLFEKTLKISTVLSSEDTSLAFAEDWFSKESGREYLFLNWEQRISAVLYSNRRAVELPLGEKKVAKNRTLNDLLAAGDPEQSARALAAVLSYVPYLNGMKEVVVTGSGAESDAYPLLVEKIQQSRIDLSIAKSGFSDHPGPYGAAASALDHFIFRQSLLDNLKEAPGRV